MINVTKTYLPSRKVLNKHFDDLYQSKWLTNNGEKLLKLESELIRFLKLENINIVSNGTIALQIALKALDIKGKVITTPFTYVATLNSIIWENCTPIFADVNASDGNMSIDSLKKIDLNGVDAILAVHVYGNPCDVDSISKFAKENNLKVIYDAAHAFNVYYDGKNVLEYGDVSTLSFHATKLFHTVEGGGVVCNSIDPDSVFLLKSFGHRGDEYYLPGINGKCSEVHAAFGLSVLDEYNKIHSSREKITEYYDSNINFNSSITRLRYNPKATRNYAYYPLIFNRENTLLKVDAELRKKHVYARRYFYPALNELEYVQSASCPIAEDLAKRVLCIPLYSDLKIHEVDLIVDTINASIV